MKLVTYIDTVRTIEEAWIRSMYHIMHSGREYRKDGGTRAGLLRKSLDFCAITITHPETRPLSPVVRPGCISTCTDDDAETYLREYLYNTEEPSEKESYTYAQFLTPAVHWTAKHFARNGLYVQQATMPVGTPADVLGYVSGNDPEYSMPCLRLIDCRIIRDNDVDKLCYYVYFRAWNHFGAFPLNMAGIQLLKELHCTIIEHEAGKPVQPGPTFAISKDLHINEPEWQAAQAWLQ